MNASAGIMQVETTENLSAEESIGEFYIWLERQIKERDLAYDGDWVEELAWEYNNDSKYAEAVKFIYDSLEEYLEKVPRFRKIFCMRDELKNTEGYEYLRELQQKYQQGILSKEKYKRKKQRFLKRVR